MMAIVAITATTMAAAIPTYRVVLAPASGLIIAGDGVAGVGVVIGVGFSVGIDVGVAVGGVDGDASLGMTPK